MSNTYKHKNKGKFNNGLLEEIPTDLENLFDRLNNDWGEFRKAKKDLKDKIAEKEMQEEVKKDGYCYDDEIVWDKQGEFCNDYCCTVKDEEIVNKYVINKWNGSTT